MGSVCISLEGWRLCLERAGLCDFILTGEGAWILNWTIIKDCVIVPGHWWLHHVIMFGTSLNSTYWGAGSPGRDAWEVLCSLSARPTLALGWDVRWPLASTSGLWWCQTSSKKPAWDRGYLSRRPSRNRLDKGGFIEGGLFLADTSNCLLGELMEGAESVPSLLPLHGPVYESLGSMRFGQEDTPWVEWYSPNHTPGVLRHPKENVCGEGRWGHHTLSRLPSLLWENKEELLEIMPAFPEVCPYLPET